MTSKLIKASLLLFVSILFLTACSSNNTSESSTPNSDKTSLNTQLTEKIDSKQKYIVIEQKYNTLLANENEHQSFIEKQADFMSSKGYEMKHQNITSTRTGNISEIILTFELKDQ